MSLRAAVRWFFTTARDSFDDAERFARWLTLPIDELVAERQAEERRSRIHAVQSMGARIVQPVGEGVA